MFICARLAECYTALETAGGPAEPVTRAWTEPQDAPGVKTGVKTGVKLDESNTSRDAGAANLQGSPHAQVCARPTGEPTTLRLGLSAVT